MIRSPEHAAILTPNVSDVGDGDAQYRVVTDRAVRDLEEDDDDDRRSSRRESSEPSTTIGPDVEMRAGGTPASDEPSSRHKSLALKQLERFRRAMDPRGGRRQGRHGWRGARRTHQETSFDDVFGQDANSASRELRFVVYPKAMWTLGALILIAATVFVTQVSAKDQERERLGQRDVSVWWKYVVGAVVYALGLIVVVTGRVETFVLSKDTGKLSVYSTKPLCVTQTLRRTRRFERELRFITDVRVEASGEILSREVDTRSYKVVFDFDNGTHRAFLEGRSKRKAQHRCRLIQQFLLSCQGTTLGARSAAATGPAPGLTSAHLALVSNPAPSSAQEQQQQQQPQSPRKMVAAVPSTTLSVKHIVQLQPPKPQP
ncbi:hypothetical protein P43SY_009353 [Pythium insidiosum]|uniref:Transmembrane protein n=1 Tax=Pythium insidiosum TaxID=114742 RepID=A0AAD5M5Y5_PYTIN|nr:hypothetical protein P43SY_009353 [Pythium insidiosum]